jgi:hypothetical protein
MVVLIRKKMENMQDLTEFESCLRRLYNTTSGVCCQALLTTSYLKWSKELRSHLNLQLDCNVYEELLSTHSEENGCQNNAKTFIEAYLPGFRILYFENECTVHQILPRQCQNSHTQCTQKGSMKRKLHSLQEHEVDAPNTVSVLTKTNCNITRI